MAGCLIPPALEHFGSMDWTDVSFRVSRTLRAALEQVLETRDGGALSRTECLALANAEDDDLLGLLVAANNLRRELSGNIVSYVVNRNINFTNICFVGCKFCAFWRKPRESDTYFLEPHQVSDKALQAWKVGAT